MNQADEQLVQTIADLVVEALNKKASTAARVSPPAGLCTAGGDSEVYVKPSPAGAVKPVTMSMQHDAANIVPAAVRPHLGGIVTSNQLQDAIKSSPDKVVMLARDARLTPLAQDLVRTNPSCVKRENVHEHDASLRRLNHGLPWSWWTCCHCEVIRKTVAERASMMIPLTVPRQPISIAQAVMEADALVRAGRVAGAVLFVRQAARAMCLANRRRSLRAILGNCDEAVAMGVHEIGANVLVLEFPYVTYEQMTARVDMVLRSEARPPAEMSRFLLDVEGRG